MQYGTVQVGYVNGDRGMETLAFNTGETVSTMLEKAGLEVSEGEKVRDKNGVEVSLSSPVEDGGQYFITENVKAQ